MGWSDLLLFLIIPGISSGRELFGAAKYAFEMRSIPSFDGAPVEKIHKSQKLKIVERFNDWLKAESSGTEGWIATKWVDMSGDISELPNHAGQFNFQKEREEPAYTPFDKHLYGNSRFRVAANEKPKRNSGFVFWLKEGEMITILGVLDDWYKAKSQKGTG